jgi:hypothetical protein
MTIDVSWRSLRRGGVNNIIDECVRLLSKAAGHVEAMRVNPINQFVGLFWGHSILNGADDDADRSGNGRTESPSSGADTTIIGDDPDRSVVGCLTSSPR